MVRLLLILTRIHALMISLLRNLGGLIKSLMHSKHQNDCSTNDPSIYVRIQNTKNTTVYVAQLQM